MLSDLYVYYKVPVDNAPLLLKQVARMQRLIMADLGVRVALKRRPDVQDGRHTWMEVYYQVPSDFEKTLALAVAKAELESVIQGPRHAEWFLDIATE